MIASRISTESDATALRPSPGLGARLPVSGPTRAELRLADGTILVSDVYRPDIAGTFPVLLMRQPYGKRIASTVVLAHPAWYASHGYVVVIQDARGTGESGGDFHPLENEIADGAATLDWAADLPGSNGRVGLYGFSYQGITQYLALAGAAKTGGRRPDAIAPAMAAWDIRNDWVFEGNAFRSGLNAGWAMQMAGPRAVRSGDEQAIADILSVPAYSGGARAMLERYPQFSHFRRWLADDAAYWRAVSPSHLLDGVDLDVPCLHIGGWADFMLTGTLKADAAFRAANEATSHLIVGPWTHIPWNRSSGVADMGPNAAIPVDTAIVAFFDHYLKGVGETPAPVRLYDVGRGTWRTLSAMPEPDYMPVFLASSGLAATTVADGRLTMEPHGPEEDRLVHDPFRPAPLVGGHVGDPPGFADRRAADDRTDAAVYTLPPFPRAVELIGPVACEVFVAADLPSFDLSATLSLVGHDGLPRVLSTGHIRCDKPAAGPVRVEMRSVTATIMPGQTLRLSLAAAAAPAFAINPGTGENPDLTPAHRQQVTTLTIRHGHDTPSRLILPVVT